MNAIGDLDSSSSEDEALATVLDRRSLSHSNQADGQALKKQKVVSPTPPAGSFVPPFQALPPVKSIPISKGDHRASAASTAAATAPPALPLSSGGGGIGKSSANKIPAASSDHPLPIDMDNIAPHKLYYKEK